MFVISCIGHYSYVPHTYVDKKCKIMTHGQSAILLVFCTITAYSLLFITVSPHSLNIKSNTERKVIFTR